MEVILECLDPKVWKSSRHWGGCVDWRWAWWLRGNFRKLSGDSTKISVKLQRLSMYKYLQPFLFILSVWVSGLAHWVILKHSISGTSLSSLLALTQKATFLTNTRASWNLQVCFDELRSTADDSLTFCMKHKVFCSIKSSLLVESVLARTCTGRDCQEV